MYAKCTLPFRTNLTSYVGMSCRVHDTYFWKNNHVIGRQKNSFYRHPAVNIANIFGKNISKNNIGPCLPGSVLEQGPSWRLDAIVGRGAGGRELARAAKQWHGLRILRVSDLKSLGLALAAWPSSHRVCLQNRESQVRIPPGCKVVRSLFQCFCQKLNMHRHCLYLRKINALGLC
jgi:hypothetical protein